MAKITYYKQEGTGHYYRVTRKEILHVVTDNCINTLDKSSWDNVNNTYVITPDEFYKVLLTVMSNMNLFKAK